LGVQGLEMTKRDQVREFINKESAHAIEQHIAGMFNREAAEIIRLNRHELARAVGWQIAEEYRFLELADIMEWKRSRVRR